MGGLFVPPTHCLSRGAGSATVKVAPALAMLPDRAKSQDRTQDRTIRAEVTFAAYLTYGGMRPSASLHYPKLPGLDSNQQPSG